MLFGLGVAVIILLAAVLRGCFISLTTPSQTADNDLIEIGHTEEFPPGTVRAIELPVPFEPPPFVIENLDLPPGAATPTPGPLMTLPLFVVHDAEAGFFIFYQNSPFRGCTVVWAEANHRFENPCHGDKYTVTGDWIEGPSTRGLDRFPVQVQDDGRIFIDTSTLSPGSLLPTSTTTFTPVPTLTPSATPQPTPSAVPQQSLDAFLDDLQNALNESDLEALEAAISPIFVTGVYPLGTSSAVKGETLSFLEWRLLPQQEEVDFQEADNASLPAELTAETLFDDKAAHITVIESSGWGPDGRIKGLFYILEEAGAYQWAGLVLTSGEFAPLPELATIPLPAGLVYHDRFDWRLVGDNGEETVLIHHNPRLSLNPSATLALKAEHGAQAVTLFHLPWGGDGETIELNGRLMTDAWRIPWLDDQTAVLAVTDEADVRQATTGQLALLHTATGQLTLLGVEVDSYVQPSVTAAGTIVYGMDDQGQLLAWRDGQAVSLPIAGLGGDINSLSRAMLSPDGTLLAGVASSQDAHSQNAHPAAYAVVGMEQPVGVRVHPYSTIGTDAVLPTGITWSPDSRWLALLPPASDIVVNGLWLAAADGSAKVHLGPGTRNPVWLDANRIVYSATVLGVDSLQLYDLTTGEANWLDTSQYEADPLDRFFLNLPPNIHAVQIVEGVE